jgi:regulatory protein
MQPQPNNRMGKTDNATLDKAVSYAYRLCDVRPRSEWELRDRLSRKGFAGSTVSTVVSRLKEQDIIDDHKFAKLWIASRMNTNPKGVIALRKELKEKGVPETVIDAVLTGGKDAEVSVIRKVAAERMERLKGLPKGTAKKRLFDFLARRGFDFDAIHDVVRETFDAGS